MRIVVALIAFVILVIGLFFLFIYSGVYNVAATKPHTGLGWWVFDTITERSIHRHAAEGINVPPLWDSSQIQAGFHEYNEMCVTCHGAPGVLPPEIGKGFTPKPPDLAKLAQKMTSAELYWVVRNGIKMTGMPAFGPTHNEKELWAIIAFLKNRLPTLSPDEYRAMAIKEVTEGRQQGHKGEHSHDH